MIDPDVAQWLTGLLAQTFAQLERHPGLTCEVEEDPKRWVQVIPETTEGRLSGILLNFAYAHAEEPLATLTRVDMTPPPDTRVAEWEADGFARLWIRPDIPVAALALFIGDIIEKVLEAPQNYALAAWIESGY